MERIIRVPKSVKSLFVESGILGIGIRRNTVKGICRYSVHYICLRQQNSVLFRVVAQAILSHKITRRVHIDTTM